MNKIETIIEKCIEANPSTLGRACDCHDRLCEMCVLGRTVANNNLIIRLADVLLAINIIGAYSIGADGRFIFEGEWIGSPFAVTWNLKDNDLENQSENTIDFIYDLLKN